MVVSDRGPCGIGVFFVCSKSEHRNHVVRGLLPTTNIVRFPMRLLPRVATRVPFTGRRTDPETGKIYHLKFNPPKVDPDDESEEAAAKATAETEAIVARLTQREDDTEEALAKRLEAFDSNRAAIEDAFSAMAKVVDGNREKSSVWEDVKAFFSA